MTSWMKEGGHPGFYTISIREITVLQQNFANKIASFCMANKLYNTDLNIWTVRLKVFLFFFLINPMLSCAYKQQVVMIWFKM